MTTRNKYIDRLYNEWKQHSKIIIGVDFDSTISPYHTIDNDSDIHRCIKLLKTAKETGAYIVLYTCCGEDRYDSIISYFHTTFSFPPDSINRNPIELPYGNQSKPYCNIYLDDRAGFIESMDILESAMYLIRGDIQTKNIIFQQF